MFCPHLSNLNPSYKAILNAVVMNKEGWLGGVMVLGKLPVPESPANMMIV